MTIVTITGAKPWSEMVRCLCDHCGQTFGVRVFQWPPNLRGVECPRCTVPKAERELMARAKLVAR